MKTLRFNHNSSSSSNQIALTFAIPKEDTNLIDILRNAEYDEMLVEIIRATRGNPDYIRAYGDQGSFLEDLNDGVFEDLSQWEFLILTFPKDIPILDLLQAAL